MLHHGGWWSYLSYDESKGRPQIDRQLLRRVLAYARPYGVLVVLVLVTIVAISLLGLVPPLLYRDLIDNVLPNRDLGGRGHHF
jgi:ATP-binding cassette subfamily B protein